jgi:hypothetical protein
LRHLLTQDADVFSDVDRPLWYDLNEELRERCEAVCLRRVFGKTGERSNLEGDRSNLEGDRSNLEDDRGKRFRAGASQAASAAKS